MTRWPAINLCYCRQANNFGNIPKSCAPNAGSGIRLQCQLSNHPSWNVTVLIVSQLTAPLKNFLNKDTQQDGWHAINPDHELTYTDMRQTSEHSNSVLLHKVSKYKFQYNCLTTLTYRCMSGCQRVKRDPKWGRKMPWKCRKCASISITNFSIYKLHIVVLSIFMPQTYFFLLQIWAPRGYAVLLLTKSRKRLALEVMYTSVTQNSLIHQVTDCQAPNGSAHRCICLTLKCHFSFLTTPSIDKLTVHSYH